MHHREILLFSGGLSMTANQWADKYSHIHGMSAKLILARYNRGWSVQKSVTTPSRNRTCYIEQAKMIAGIGSIKINENKLEYDPLLQFKRLINQVGEIEAIKRMSGVIVRI